MRRTIPFGRLRVCTSSKHRSCGSAAAAATNSVSSGTTPPSPRTGSSRIRPTSSSAACCSASTSFGGTKRTPGHERLERRPLARLASGRQRAERPPVEASLERDDARLPRGLARVLERRLDRLRARVAEERLRAAEPRGEPRRELLGRLRAVEVRGVPEAVELCLRGRERRGMTVAERDDRDPASEVEVLAAVGVPHPAALAADDRHVRARVGRQQPIQTCDRRSRDAPPSRRSRRAIAEPRRPNSREELRDDAAVEDARAEQLVGVRRRRAAPRRRPRRRRPATSDTKTIRSAPSPTASAAAASSALTFSGPTAIGVTIGIRPAARASSTASGRHGSGSPTRPSSGRRVATRPISSPTR